LFALPQVEWNIVEDLPSSRFASDSLLLVDPSSKPQQILEALDGRIPDAIVLTHCHWDHVGAAFDIREATGAPVIASAIDARVITGEVKLDMRVHDS
jgi:glyoxylase-like metal-dependent hydrolase (beta-lactamase superfamily II)